MDVIDGQNKVFQKDKMKIGGIIVLMFFFSQQVLAQGIVSLESKLSSGTLTTSDSIEVLNLAARELLFVNSLKALDYANQALKLSTKTNNSIGIAYAYRSLSAIYRYDESYFISMEYLQRALDIFEMNSDSAGIANCYVTLGHTYRLLQNRQQEVEYHKKSFEMFSRLNDAERIGVTAHNLGESYFNMGDLENARKLTKYALGINDSIGNQAVLSSCFKVMGMIEMKENNLDQAEDYFKKVLDLSDQLGENSQKIATIESMIQLAEVYKLRGDFNNQVKFLLMAANVSSRNNLSNYLLKAYQELILYSSLANDQKSVRDYIYSYKVVSDSLNQKHLRDKYRLTEGVVQVHELSQSKAKLEEVNLVQSQKIQSRNTLLLVIGIFSVVLLWLLFKFVNLNKKLKSQNSIIELQKKDLEALNSSKDKFFSIVAHDLKSPLNALKGFSGLLIDHFDHLNKDEIKTMSQQLQASVDNTIKMADNLIAWARVQMNDHQYNEERIEVKEIVSNIFELYKEAASKKAINIRYSVEDSVAITGDKNQIEFVLRNLLDNAIKFTEKDGVIVLTAKSLPNREVQISVSDNGVGIPDELKSNLFSVGRKQGASGTNGEKGTGLGLMLSYEFVQLNGGQLTVDSSLGEGTEFRARFRSGQ